VTKTEADEFLQNWWLTTEKVFRYRQELLEDEYMIIMKKNNEEFVPDKPRSTYKLEPMDKDAISSLLQSQVLVYHVDAKWSTDCRVIKTGGCDCGGHKNRNWGHSYWCELVKKGIFKRGVK
jgi:hypothetical protein